MPTIFLLTSVYLLTFAAAQIPIGILFDRYGPPRVQSVLLVVAAAGSAFFAVSDHFWILLVGRALIGLDVASAMTAGLKAIVLWFPEDRVPLLNGLMVMLGALGAVTATLPTDLLLDRIGWPELFDLFAALTAASAVMIYLIVPEATQVPSSSGRTRLEKDLCRSALLARCAALDILHWNGLGPTGALGGAVVQGRGWPRSLGRSVSLFAIAVALSLGAILLGVAADRPRRRGVGPEALLGLVAAVFIATQFALILRLPVPSYLQWAVVAAVGAATVLSFAILAEYFPKELAGRANRALNLFHVAFVVKYATGVVFQRGRLTLDTIPKPLIRQPFVTSISSSARRPRIPVNLQHRTWPRFSSESVWCHYRKSPRSFDGADEDRCAVMGMTAARRTSSPELHLIQPDHPFLRAAFSAHKRVIGDVASSSVRGRRSKCADARRSNADTAVNITGGGGSARVGVLRQMPRDYMARASHGGSCEHGCDDQCS